METPRTISAKFPDLAGRVAIVTGAGGGIGRAVCELLAREGMKLVCSDYKQEMLDEALVKLAESSADYITHACNLTSREGAQSLLDAAMEAYGVPYLLVNVAGVLGSGPFLKTDDEVLETTTFNNIRMCYFLSRIVAEKMVEVGCGRIINFTSVGAERPHNYQTLYDTSKGAISTLTKSMALALGDKGICVNAVVPGATYSPHKKFFQNPKWLKHLEEKRPLIPLRRLGQPEDSAAMVAFLASDCADYITGAIMHVDGGISTQLAPPGFSI